MITVVDDRLVQSLLLGRRLPIEGAITTTTHWWWRLALALRRGTGGALSAPVLELPELERSALTRAVDRLDTALELVDFRELLPVAVEIAAVHRVNLLAAEALALCLVDRADLVVGVDSPPLAAAATALDISYRVA